MVFCTCTSCSSDSMCMCVYISCHIKIDHSPDVRDVQPSSWKYTKEQTIRQTYVPSTHSRMKIWGNLAQGKQLSGTSLIFAINLTQNHRPWKKRTIYPCWDNVYNWSCGSGSLTCYICGDQDRHFLLLKRRDHFIPTRLVHVSMQ